MSFLAALGEKALKKVTKLPVDFCRYPTAPIPTIEGVQRGRQTNLAFRRIMSDNIKPSTKDTHVMHYTCDSAKDGIASQSGMVGNPETLIHLLTKNYRIHLHGRLVYLRLADLQESLCRDRI